MLDSQAHQFLLLLCGLSDVQLESDMMRFELEPLSSISNLLDVQIEIFPNPASDFINITGDINEFSKVRLVNGFGQVIQAVTSQRVNVQNLASGNYYLQFFKGDGVYTEKITLVN